MAICVSVDSSNFVIANGAAIADCSSLILISPSEFQASESQQIQILSEAITAFDASISSFLTFDLALFGALLAAGALSFLTGWSGGIISRLLSRS